MDLADEEDLQRQAKAMARVLVDHALAGLVPDSRAIPEWFYDWAALMEPAELLQTRFRFLGDGRHCICIVAYMFTRAIIYGRLDDHGSHEDRWCFHDIEKAVGAFDAWEPAFDRRGKLVNEPTGWHRHPYSDRIRPDGDPARETVGYPQAPLPE